MKLQKFLISCGILASILYVGIDFLAAIVHPEHHSFTSQSISELMARGAPTERLVDPLFLLYSVLMVAFGVGVFRSDNRVLTRVTASLLLAYAAIGLPGPLVFEMSPRGVSPSSGDVVNIVISVLLVVSAVLTMAVAAWTRGREFCFYSMTTVAVMLLFGTLTFFAGRGLATAEPTPWLGVAERITIGSFLLWVAVFATMLLRDDRERRAVAL